MGNLLPMVYSANHGPAPEGESAGAKKLILSNTTN